MNTEKIREANLKIAEKLKELGIQSGDKEEKWYISSEGTLTDWFMDHHIDTQEMLSYYRKFASVEFLLKVEAVVERLELIKKIHFAPNQMYELHYDKGWDGTVIGWYEENAEWKKGSNWRKKTLKILEEKGFKAIEEKIKLKILFEDKKFNFLLQEEITKLLLEAKLLEKEIERDLNSRITEIFETVYKEYKEDGKPL